MDSRVLLVEVCLAVVGFTGVAISIRACLGALQSEDAGAMEVRLRWGLRLGNGAMFAIALLDFVATEIVSRQQWGFVYYIAVYALVNLVVLIPLRGRVTRVRKGKGWSVWPSRLPL